MRLFFGVDERDVHDGVVALSSKIGGGVQKNSLLVNCCIGTANVENSILINVSAKSVTGKGVILYNVADEGDVALEDGFIITDVALPAENKIFRMTSTLDTNGRDAWEERVHGSPYSAAEVHKLHQVCCQTILSQSFILPDCANTSIEYRPPMLKVPSS